MPEAGKDDEAYDLAAKIHYFPNEENRTFKSAFDESCSWILRSLDSYSDVLFVDYDSEIDSCYGDDDARFRPTMWIDISNID